MSSSTLTSILISTLVMTSAGLVLGLMYFRMLRWTVENIVGGRGGLWSAALTVGRFVCALVVLTVAAKSGAVALLAALAGFSLARLIALRVVWRTG